MFYTCAKDSNSHMQKHECDIKLQAVKLKWIASKARNINDPYLTYTGLPEEK